MSDFIACHTTKDDIHILTFCVRVHRGYFGALTPRHYAVYRVSYFIVCRITQSHTHILASYKRVCGNYFGARLPRHYLASSLPRVTMAEYRLFYRALLQKRPIIFHHYCHYDTSHVPPHHFPHYGMATIGRLLKMTGLFCRTSFFL